MENAQLTEWQIQVSSTDATVEELDQLTRQLLSELRELDLEAAGLVGAGAAPAGSKAVDPVTIGSIAITVLPAVLPKVVEAVQAWVLRGNNRTVKFKGKVGGQAIEFEGSAQDLDKLLSRLSAGNREGLHKTVVARR